MNNREKEELILIIRRLNSLGFDKKRIKEIICNENLYFNFSNPLSFVKNNLTHRVFEYIDWLEVQK